MGIVGRANGNSVEMCRFGLVWSWLDVPVNIFQPRCDRGNIL